MLNLPSGTKVYVASNPVRMCLSFDGLSDLVRGVLRKDPFSEQLFIFFNKRKDKVKILYWDRNGYAIWYKRLEGGIFRTPRIKEDCYVLTIGELSMLLEGIDLTDKSRFSSLNIRKNNL